MDWALRLQGTCGPPLGSKFSLVRCHVSPIHGWEACGLSEHGLVWWNFEGCVQKKANHLFHFDLLPSLVGMRFDVWSRVHVVCLYYLPHIFLAAHGWGPQVCTSALDNEFHMNAMYICCAFELIDWPLMQRLVGDLRYALWFWLIEYMCILNTRRVYVIHVICLAQGLFDLWPICSHIPSSLVETEFRY